MSVLDSPNFKVFHLEESFFSDLNNEMASSVISLFYSPVPAAPAFTPGLIEGVVDGVCTLVKEGQDGIAISSAKLRGHGYWIAVNIFRYEI